RDMKRAALQSRETFRDERLAAIDQAGLFSAVLQSTARDVLIIALVGLPEVRRVGIGNRTLPAHPVHRRARVEPARKRDADFFAYRNGLQDFGHRQEDSNVASGLRLQA